MMGCPIPLVGIECRLPSWMPSVTIVITCWPPELTTCWIAPSTDSAVTTSSVATTINRLVKELSQLINKALWFQMYFGIAEKKFLTCLLKFHLAHPPVNAWLHIVNRHLSLGQHKAFTFWNMHATLSWFTLLINEFFFFFNLAHFLIDTSHSKLMLWVQC